MTGVIQKICLACLVLAMLASCAAPGPAPAPSGRERESAVLARTADYMLVRVNQGDTLESLAQWYLGDVSHAWILARVNRTDRVAEGDEILVPTKPVFLGGLDKGGYQRVPVLLYHNFSEKTATRMTMPRATFDAQMRYLAENGYTTITLDRLLDFIRYEKPLPPKSVAITIDDGWRSTYTIAWPVLKKYGHVATLFLYTDFVGGDRAMTWAQLREIDKNGIDVQNHSKTHRKVTLRKAGESMRGYVDALVEEIAEPHREIMRNLGKEPRHLAYPYGDTNPLFSTMVEGMGYRSAFTATRGANAFYTDRYHLGRSVVYGDWGMERFKKTLDVYREAAP
ncbi:MAG: polysaccharide deacetylase family protein [Desulfatibacillaceae bacterium]